MKRKLPVLIAIILALVIALAACQPLAQPAIPGNQSDPLPSYAETTPATTAPTVEPQLITMDEAIAIALKDAGFSEKDVTGLHAELDKDDGRTIYEVDFYKGGTEYDYELNAATGKIIKAEKDRND